MNNSSDISKELTLDVFRKVQHNDFQYIYRGRFTQIINEEILALSEMNLSKIIDKSIIRKRIYFIMLEGLQNITRHEHKVQQTSPSQSSILE